MKVHLKGVNTIDMPKILDFFGHTAHRAMLGIDNHRFNRQTGIIDMPDTDAELYITSLFKITGYCMWLEIPKGFTGALPANITWTKKVQDGHETIVDDITGEEIDVPKYIDVPITIEDFQVHSSGVTHDIVYCQGYTNDISKHDVSAFWSDGWVCLCKSELFDLISDPDGEYYVDPEII